MNKDILVCKECGVCFVTKVRGWCAPQVECPVCKKPVRFNTIEETDSNQLEETVEQIVRDLVPELLKEKISVHVVID